MLWKNSRSFGSCLTCLNNMQVSEWTRFVKLKRSQKNFQLTLVRIRTFNIYVETTQNNQVFIFTQSFTNYFIHFLKHRWSPIYTKTDPLFLWNCKLKTDTLTIIRFMFFNLLQIKPCLTNSISPPPYLCLTSA